MISDMNLIAAGAGCGGSGHVTTTDVDADVETIIQNKTAFLIFSISAPNNVTDTFFRSNLDKNIYANQTAKRCLNWESDVLIFLTINHPVLVPV